MPHSTEENSATPAPLSPPKHQHCHPPPSQKRQDLEAQRLARAEEARQRAAFNQQRAAHASALEQSKRERLAAKLESKLAKVDEIMVQRELLVKEVQKVQASMAEQEQRMKAALDEMEVGGGGSGLTWLIIKGGGCGCCAAFHCKAGRGV